MKKISVIIPVYKVEKFLNRCIESVVSQTYENLEIILVDDGSPDNCGLICDEWAKKDNRIRVFHKENGGLSSARNKGLEQMTGDYFAFVDSDDWIDPDTYAEMLKLAESTGADIVSSGYRFYRPWKKERKVLDGEYNGSVVEYTNEEAVRMLYFGPQMFGGIPIMVWSKLYRSDALKHLKFVEGYIHEDTEYTPRALMNAKKIVKLDRSFYNYNIHLGVNSTSGMGMNLLKIKSLIQMSRRTADLFSMRYVDKVSEYVEALHYGHLISGYYECWANGKKSQEYTECTNLKKCILQECMEKRNRILSIRPDWKTKIFFFSPQCYCICVWGLRSAKQIKYKIYTRITKKN